MTNKISLIRNIMNGKNINVNVLNAAIKNVHDKQVFGEIVDTSRKGLPGIDKIPQTIKKCDYRHNSDVNSI